MKTLQLKIISKEELLKIMIFDQMSGPQKQFLKNLTLQSSLKYQNFKNLIPSLLPYKCIKKATLK